MNDVEIGEKDIGQTIPSKNEDGIAYLATLKNGKINVRRYRDQRVMEKIKSKKYNDVIIVRSKTIKIAEKVARVAFAQRLQNTLKNIKQMSLS